MISQTLVMTADTAMTGRLGVEPQAAAGMSGMILWTLLSFLMGGAIGVQIIAAGREGEKNYREAGRTLTTTLACVAPAGVLIALLGFFFADRIIPVFSDRSEIQELAVPFLQIRFWGILFYLPAIILSGFFDGLGRTKIVMFSSFLTAGGNILLNWWLIYGGLGMPALGLNGAALASTIAGFLGLSVYLAVLPAPSLRRYFTGPRSGTSFLQIARKVFLLSLPAALEGFIMHAAIMAFYRFSSDISSVSMAATNIVVTILSFSFMPGYAFGIAATTLTGMALGAKKPSLAYASAHRSAHFSGIVMSGTGLVFLAFHAPFISFFTPDPAVLREAIPCLILVALAQPADGYGMVMSGALRGAGRVYQVLFINSIGSFVVMLPVAYVLAFPLGLETVGLWIAILCWIIFVGIAFLLRFNRVMRGSFLGAPRTKLSGRTR